MATLLEVLGLKKASGDEPPPPSGRARSGAMSESVPGGEAAEKRFKAFADRVDAELVKARAEIDSQPNAVLKALLEADLAKVKAARKEADALDKTAGAGRVAQLEGIAHALTLRAAKMKTGAVAGQRDFAAWASGPMTAVQAKLEALPADLKAIFKPRFDALKKRVPAAQALLDKGDFDGLAVAAGQLFYAWQDLEKAIDGYAVEYPKYAELRGGVAAMLKRIEGGGLLDGSGKGAVGALEASLGAADALGPIRGYAAARASLNTILVKAKTLRDSNTAYRNYAPERAKVDKLVAALRAHKQAAQITAEIKRIDDALLGADALAKLADGGSLKALTALRTITQQCGQAQALADKLVEAEKKLPELTGKLESGGVPKNKVADTARYAMKLLVEENCSTDEAVKMARDARGFVDEGMSEPDAIMSSRVTKSLEDDGLPEAHAKAIGKNIRVGGTATGDDAKALGKGMKHVSQKAIDTLTADNIHSECCRGPITDAIPELAGVKPRGWPETSSWDDVAGVYKGDAKKLVVGTMAKGKGRAVPKAGEGPVPHGSSDLFGHEAGHAFDAANGGGKKGNAAFLAARTTDITAGKAGGGMAGSKNGGSDDYYLSALEGGANDSGAASETFAESFAMYFGASRWKALNTFWKSNPWGI